MSTRRPTISSSPVSPSLPAEDFLCLYLVQCALVGANVLHAGTFAAMPHSSGCPAGRDRSRSRCCGTGQPGSGISRWRKPVRTRRRPGSRLVALTVKAIGNVLDHQPVGIARPRWRRSMQKGTIAVMRYRGGCPCINPPRTTHRRNAGRRGEPEAASMIRASPPVQANIQIEVDACLVGREHRTGEAWDSPHGFRHPSPRLQKASLRMTSIAPIHQAEWTRFRVKLS